QPGFERDADVHLAATQASLASYEARYGPYPWSTVTIVHAPEEGEGAGGMEYPTLFTTSDRAPLPQWVRRHLLEERVSGVFTTVHEFGHQYFQGLFASREHLEPWLDEGINSMSNFLVLMDRHEDPWVLELLGNPLYLNEVVSLAQGPSSSRLPLTSRASDFEQVPGSYGPSTYTKVAAVMLTLREIVGHDAFDRAFRVYAEEARFRHPRGEDLERVLLQELGARVNVAPAGHEPVWLDVGEYLDQGLRSVARVGFGVARVRHRALPQGAGWRRDASGELVGGEPPEDRKLRQLEDSEVEALVVVDRRKDFRLPVEIEIEFADGTTEMRAWDGQEGSVSLRFEGRRVRHVHVDPRGKLWLEQERLDNRRLARIPGETGDDGVSGPLGRVAEAVALAILGGTA
ncbi:MAG: hypothetical protein MI919_17205, partial [Holophagales bacterium]|nr:hypothetical protein [Holophagales bacterium]